MARWIDMGPKARSAIARREAQKIDFDAWRAMIDAEEATVCATRTGTLLALALERIERDREALARMMAASK
jgi:hypothetical protein